MNSQEKIKLLASDGMLIKRPLFISDKKIFIGFKEEEWKKYYRQNFKRKNQYTKSKIY